MDNYYKNIKITKPYMNKDDIDSVVKVLKDGTMFAGNLHNKFEQKLSQYLGVKYACAVSSGTAGLHLAIMSIGIKKGDEVITSPFSFISSVNCILYEGAIPVFADIEEDTFNMNPFNIEHLITKRTKAILIPHIFGQSAKMDKILEIAKKNKLKIIEDACESIGATYENNRVGSMGDVSVFSFAPNKQIATAEGGAVTTNSSTIYDIACNLRNLGRKDKNGTITYVNLGYNYKINQVSASLGITQLQKIDMMVERRNKIAYWYNQYLNGIPYILLPKIEKNATHTFFAYAIRITNGKRNDVQYNLSKKGIETKAYFSALHLQPFIKKSFGFKKGNFPITEKVSKEILALPIFVELSKDRVKYISQQIRQFMLTKNI